MTTKSSQNFEAGQSNLPENAPQSPVDTSNERLKLRQSIDTKSEAEKQLADLKAKTLERKNALKAAQPEIASKKFHSDEYPDTESFAKAAQKADTKIDALELSVKNNEHKPDTSLWALDTQGLQNIYLDFKNLGLYAEDPKLYDSVFATLHKANEAFKSGELDNSPVKSAYMKVSHQLSDSTSASILSSLTTIKLAPSSSFAGINTEQFVESYILLSKQKDIVNKLQKQDFDRAKDSTQVSALKGIDNGIASIGSLYKDTLKSGNWFKIAALGLGSFMAYKVGKKVLWDTIWKNKKGSMKTLAVLAAIGGGAYFASDAVKDYANDTVGNMKFTSKDPIDNIFNNPSVKGNPDIESVKDYDAGTLDDMSDLPLASLTELYELGQNGRYIPPSHPLFNKIYPDFTNKDASFLTASEQAATKNKSGLWSTGSFDTSNSDLIKKGREIFMAIDALRVAVSLSSIPETQEYYSMSLSDINKKFPGMKISDILNALELNSYVEQREIQEDIDAKNLELSKRISDPSLNARITEKVSNQPNTYKGVFLNYPATYKLDISTGNFKVLLINKENKVFELLDIPKKPNIDKAKIVEKVRSYIWKDGGLNVYLATRFSKYGDLKESAFTYTDAGAWIFRYESPNKDEASFAVLDFESNGRIILSTSSDKLLAAGMTQEEIRKFNKKVETDNSQKKIGIYNFALRSFTEMAKDFDENSKGIDKDMVRYVDKDVKNSFSNKYRARIFNNSYLTPSEIDKAYTELGINADSIDLSDSNVQKRLREYYEAYLMDQKQSIMEESYTKIDEEIERDPLFVFNNNRGEYTQLENKDLGVFKKIRLRALSRDYLKCYLDLAFYGAFSANHPEHMKSAAEKFETAYDDLNAFKTDVLSPL